MAAIGDGGDRRRRLLFTSLVWPRPPSPPPLLFVYPFVHGRDYRGWSRWRCASRSKVRNGDMGTNARTAPLTVEAAPVSGPPTGSPSRRSPAFVRDLSPSENCLRGRCASRVYSLLGPGRTTQPLDSLVASG
jgi:hypothetical protein